MVATVMPSPAMPASQSGAVCSAAMFFCGVGAELELDAALPYLICKHRAEGCIHSNHQAVPAGVDFVRVLTL